MIQLFAGYDLREAVGFHVFCQSIIDNASEPVNISPLSLSMLAKVYNGGARDGTNEFIYSRFLIPYLCGYQGSAIFMDGSDMLCKGDIAELWAMRDPWKAVQVVKHDYRTKHPRKYVGSQIEAGNADYPKKNWSSVMIMNFQHYAWRNITPDMVAKVPGRYLHRFEFIEDRFVGELPAEWNWLADEYGENPDAKLIHHTAGIPAFHHYKDTPHADEWRECLERVNYVAN
jgi:hypothetical protein